MAPLPKPSAANPAPLAFRLHHLGRLVGEVLDRNLDGGAITLGQGKFLRHIVRHDDGVTPAQLATLAGCSRANATQMLARLEASGFVRRRKNPDDTRSTKVYATAAGQRVFAEAIEVVTEFERRLRLKLGPKGAEELWALLECLP